jgi:hypothetical protein
VRASGGALRLLDATAVDFSGDELGLVDRSAT